MPSGTVIIKELCKLESHMPMGILKHCSCHLADKSSLEFCSQDVCIQGFHLAIIITIIIIIIGFHIFIALFPLGFPTLSSPGP